MQCKWKWFDLNELLDSSEHLVFQPKHAYFQGFQGNWYLLYLDWMACEWGLSILGAVCEQWLEGGCWLWEQRAWGHKASGAWCVWNRNCLKHNRRLNNNHAHVSWCHPCVYNYADGRTSDNRPTASALALLLPLSPFWCLSSRLSHSVSVSANILLNQQLWTQQCKVSVCQYSQHCGAPQMFFQHWLVMILRCHFLVSSLDIAQCNDNSTFFWLVKLIKSQ